MRRGQAYLNPSERAFQAAAQAAGWQVSKRGWPDFLAVKEGRVIAVEVKPKRSSNLKSDQRDVMEWLAKHGIECYKWSPEDGGVWERIGGNLP